MQMIRLHTLPATTAWHIRVAVNAMAYFKKYKLGEMTVRNGQRISAAEVYTLFYLP
jgi:hypothetical protein